MITKQQQALPAAKAWPASASSQPRFARRRISCRPSVRDAIACHRSRPILRTSEYFGLAAGGCRDRCPEATGSTGRGAIRLTRQPPSK